MSGTTPTPTAYLASLAAVFESATDPESRARVFAGLADEALRLAATASTRRLEMFWLDLSETFQDEARQLVDGAKPRRRWFR